MPQVVPLQTVPNQQLSLQLNDDRYDIRLHDLGDGTMSCDVSINEEIKVLGSRVLSTDPLIPYLYLQEGNFFFLTDDEYPYWENFNTTQTLLYYSASELEALNGT